MPQRIQRRRVKGWKMPPNTVSVTRPGRYGNPFKVGGFYRLGKGGNGLMWLQSYEEKHADASFTLVTTADQAVGMFREFRRRYPLPQADKEVLRGHDLACFCPLDQPCHADVLLEIANE